MKLLNLLGALFGAITGPCVTVQVPSRLPHHTHRYSPTQVDEGETVYVESKRLIYRNCYRRWWIPDTYRALYQVTGVYDGPVRESMPKAFHDTVIYPCLTHWLLSDTEYPHMAAVNAFIERIGEADPRLGLRA